MHGPGALLTGVVTEFDAARGLGRIEISVSASRTGAHGVGPSPILFHCIEIADGSRQIEVGTPVAFRLMRRLGAVEAAAVTVVRSTGP